MTAAPGGMTAWPVSSAREFFFENEFVVVDPEAFPVVVAAPFSPEDVRVSTATDSYKNEIVIKRSIRKTFRKNRYFCNTRKIVLIPKGLVNFFLSPDLRNSSELTNFYIEGFRNGFKNKTTAENDLPLPSFMNAFT